MSVRYEHGLRQSDIWKWVLLVGGISLFILSITLLWNRRLKKEINERIRAERMLSESEKRYRALFETCADGIVIVDPDTRKIKYVNPAICTMLGYTESEFKKLFADDLHPKDQLDRVMSEFKDVADGKKSHCDDIPCLRKNGSIRFTDINNTTIELMGERYLVGFFRDITDKKNAEAERVKLERQLSQAHKMEAIGTLAGGIAHDFNNILSAILGYADMCREDTPVDSPTQRHLSEVIKGATRASELVKHILTFSRQSEMDKKTVQLNLIVEDAIKLVRASIPTTIEITKELDCENSTIIADPVQIHQIMMNLCTNAAHAMEQHGGTLYISISKVNLSDSDLKNHPHLLSGTYIRLMVRDTGTGMNRKTMERIFDPYYTTKEVGKGSGIGMAVVHGIIRNHSGMITIESNPGEGSSFHVFFPEVKGTPQKKDDSSEPLPIGSERILFIDDEEVITNMVKQVLESLGYTVTAKTSSIDALELFCQTPKQFDLVITDQTMPNMTGANFSEQLLKVRPDIPIIICTGYSSLLDEKGAKAIGIKQFIMKPLIKKDLAIAIRQTLDEN